tara:strand:+ start:678 stop:1439 length:762 start_codon:yes stop_codon:yes gene_type:complete
LSSKKNNKTVVAIIEARMGSSRLPGKVLADINGVPALDRLISRLKLCKYLDDIVIATSLSPKDDDLEIWAQKNNYKCYRGSEDDVLQRVVDASKSVKCDLIVEITGDCILTDYEVIDQSILTFLENDCDVVTNCGTYLSYPMGIYTQVFRSKDLEWVAMNIDDPAIREHVSLYFYENTNKYKILNMVAPNSMNYPNWRLQLDYKEDLKLLRLIYKSLQPKYGDAFKLEHICQLLLSKPDLIDINIDCIEKNPR